MARDRNREGRRDEDDFLYEDNLSAMVGICLCGQCLRGR